MAIDMTYAKLDNLTKLSEGGEADVYEYKGNVLKIFKDKVDVASKEKKIDELMHLYKEGSCGYLSTFSTFPTDKVLIDGKFKGYEMKKITGGEALHSFSKARYIKQHRINNIVLLEIVKTIANRLTDIHSEGIIVGDISDNNILVDVGKNEVYFVDTDSWGIGNMDPDAFTETFIPPESYILVDKDKRMTLNESSDNYGFAVLAFNLLTRIHPFGGYFNDVRMNTVERMKAKISLLGDHDITYNKQLFNWSWMSPELVKRFKAIFEGKDRGVITKELLTMINNSKKCSIHNVYYYNKFSDCPLCSNKAKIKEEVEIGNLNKALGITETIIFACDDVLYMINDKSYISKNGQARYIGNGKDLSVNVDYNMLSHFASNGRYYIGEDKGYFTIIENLDDGKKRGAGHFDKAYNTRICVRGANVMYVDKYGCVCLLTLTDVGFMNKAIFPIRGALYELNDEGEHLIVGRVGENEAFVSCKDYDCVLYNVDETKDYAIKYDKVTGSWLYLTKNKLGDINAYVIAKEFNMGYKKYPKVDIECSTLGNVCFNNGTIYDPRDKKIIGLKLETGVSRIFECSVVDESCSLEFKDGGFNIVSIDKVWRME